MEVERSVPPEPGFLESVRHLCNKNDIVLIFDECSSGFRETFGGLHLKYGVFPDMAMFGKTLGNGYAITSVIGKKSVMEAAQNTFISSTFWTERIGSTAALKSLEIMESVESWILISNIGRTVKAHWLSLATSNGLDITVSGIDAMISFSFKSVFAKEYKTFITQEMLKKGYLASTIFYPSIEHTPDIIEKYIHNLGPIFKIIGDCESQRLDINILLDGPTCHDGFYRLN